MDQHQKAVLFSSDNEGWETPPDLIYQLTNNIKFDLDVAASRPNVCSNFYSPDDNGLIKPWHGLCFLNPPYGRKIPLWLDRAAEISRPGSGIGVVCLIPARTGTAWYQRSVKHAVQVTHIKGRLTFGSDHYWEWLWDQEYVIKKGKKVKNVYFEKYGRKDAAPFNSDLILFGDGIFTTKQMDFIASYGLTYRMTAGGVVRL